MLHWALSQGCPWGSRSLNILDAARSGHQALLMLVRQQGMSTTMEKWTCAQAAYAGQMATLQCMRKQGWAWGW